MGFRPLADKFFYILIVPNYKHYISVLDFLHVFATFVFQTTLLQNISDLVYHNRY